VKKSGSNPPTLRSIARTTQLSGAAVSLALRNHPSIPARTCQRVQRAAARLGYKRDPEVAKLMAYLRQARQKRKQGALGLLTLFPEVSPWRTNRHLELLHDAARARADQFGYQLEEYWLAEPGMTPARMQAVLLARGIEGFLLLGAPRWVEHLDFDFSSFACAATGYSIRNQLHRACQHQYQEMFIALQQLQARGYRRPGLVLSRDSNERTMHHWSAALLSFQQSLPARDRVPMLITPELTASQVATWLRRHRADVVLSHAPAAPVMVSWIQQAGQRVPEDCGFADLDINERADGDCSGIRQNYPQVAAAAVDLVVGQIQRNERGVPAFPKTVQITGEWVNGTTTRPR
jgi:LacI family transcriptional regulator